MNTTIDKRFLSELPQFIIEKIYIEYLFLDYLYIFKLYFRWPSRELNNKGYIKSQIMNKLDPKFRSRLVKLLSNLEPR